MSAKPTYPPLYRHRRKSSQLSPSSPSFPRRPLDRATRPAELASPFDGPSTQNATPESPPANAFMAHAPEPVPRANYHPSSHFCPAEKSEARGVRWQTRLSDEENRPHPTQLADLERPLTSGAIDTKHTMSVGPPGGPSNVHGSKTPSSAHARHASATERGSNDGFRMTSSPSPAPAMSSPLQPVERSLPDDPGSAKTVPVPGKKSRLNLLNPMSLLARRRSAHSQNDGAPLTINTMHVPALPDNFEPSIRGTITHDFSAPRTRRTPSHDYGYHADAQPSPRQAISSSLAPTMHSPVFREHFQEDQPAAFHPEQTSALLNVAKHSVGAEQLEVSMPAFAKKLPVRLPDHDPSVATPQTPPQPGSRRIPAIGVADVDRPLPETPTEDPPPPPPKRTPSPKINLPPASLLPKHMTSTSSRFSFQLGEHASSAQERLLEEKHKQFQSTKRPSSLAKTETVEDLDYDNYDLDAEDVEEEIPEVNFDYDENMDFGDSDASPSKQPPSERVGLYLQPLPSHNLAIQPLRFGSPSTSLAGHSTSPDPDGFPTGTAGSSDHLSELSGFVLLDGLDRPSDKDLNEILGGLGISDTRLDEKDTAGLRQSRAVDHGHPQMFDDADIYFDDGEFADDLQHDLQPSNDTFDEAVLDDETKIRDIAADNARRYQAAVQSRSNLKTSGSQQLSLSSKKSLHSDSSGVSQRSSSEPKPYAGPGLTEGNLEAYHHALAQAANDAAANGRFSRKVSFDASEEESQPALTSDEGRRSRTYGSSRIAEDDGFPFDDELDDDMMIAEANAEALENDDEGFYGHEFGFYARAHGKDSSEMVNGGFFAAHGSNGLKRSHSGRANFQEPSLTPITERSEWSTRNSVVSLPLHGGAPLSAQSLAGPGIAQLLELDSPGHDDDMTLSALMKLRRGAFGSSSSINSISPGGHAGSPGFALIGPHPFSAPPEHGLSRMGSSIHSLATTSPGIPESEEENDGPTLTPNTPLKKLNKTEPGPASPTVRSPASDCSDQRKVYHSRNSSGADSVSYARESDGRWMLERRRTGEDGGIEVDREYLPGARI
ncbi:hypothetical protein DV735_g301, partial [Chaetothyriales sp. CBS 134920]